MKWSRGLNTVIKSAIVFTIFSVLILCDILIKSSIASEAQEQDVVISIIPKPKIDIVLAKSRTTTDVNNFETSIINALKNVNVDPSNVKVTAVQAQTVNMETSFAWNKDISPYIGSISITNNGQNVVMNGNRCNPGKNAIWIMPDGNQEQKFNFNYSINFGDSFNAAGMLLRVKQTGNILTGYMLSFNNTWYSEAGSKNGAIWKFTYNIGTNSSNMTKTLVQGLNINTSGTLQVTATDAKIVISGGGMSSTITYNIPENDQTIGNGFGFFSDHYSHDCDSIGSFSLTGINLETTVVRSFNEVLREPDWRNNAYKFLINIDDTENEELKNVSAYSELLTRLLNEDIYFVGWGKDKNKVQFENLILSNNGNGKFIINTDYDSSINEMATYIQSIVGNKTSTETVIINEPITLSVDPPGIDKNTIDQEWPYGKWKIEHDYTYYENNIGQFAESGKYIDSLITTFNKTGKYVIKYKDLPIYPQEIFVHRKPVAHIKMQIDENTVTLTSESYDMDKLSENNGIAEEEWKWKSSDSNVWNDGKLTTIDSTKTYVIQLRVKDFQNTWSSPATRYITKDKNALPVAIYDIVNDMTTTYENIEIKDTSYDPAGREITKKLWEVYKDGTVIYSGENPKISYDEVGTYTMYLTVTNSDNISSERYGRTFEIIEDKVAPEVVANPITTDWATSTTVNIKFTDEGGSLFRGYKYAITDGQSTPTSWSEEIKKSEDNIAINMDGEKYLHIIAYDNADNESSDRILGPYKIDKSGPTIQVNVDLDTITTEGVIVNIEAEDLLSGLKTVSVNDEPLVSDGTGNFAIQVYKNGTYVINAEDNIGNVSTEEIIVTNAYNKCKAGLEHSIYSSNYDSCPICDLIEGLQITKDSEIYNSQEKKVTYNNPQNATIVEYYNNTTKKPVDSGTYEYELKVVYQGAEYNTGLKGTFDITKKNISIENITAQNRQYDGTNNVALGGGNLVGLEEGDNVGFILPEIGTTESKDIGEYNVTVPEIILTNEKASNYYLIPPKAEAVKVIISKRELTLTGLKGKDRKYDKTNIVEMEGGQLQNIVGEEIVTAIIPETGIIPDSDIGTWTVEIEPIEIEGIDSGNYILIQPETEEILVTIAKPDQPHLHLETFINQINEKKLKNVEPTVKIVEVDANDTNKENNEQEYIQKTVQEDIQKFVQEYTQETEQEYTKEDDTQEVNQKAELKNINQNVEENVQDKANDESSESKTDKELVVSYEKTEQLEEIRYADTIQINMRIYNEGKGAGYAQKITNVIPEGMRFIKDNEINQENGWEEIDNTTVVTEKLNFDSGTDNQIENLDEENIDYREVSLVLEVETKEALSEELQNKTIIEQVDIREEQIDFENQLDEEVLPITISYTDFVIENTIQKVVQISTEEQSEQEIVLNNKRLNKVEIDAKKINSTKLKIIYNIAVTNNGSTKGKVDSIINYLPTGIEYSLAENPEWTKNDENSLICESFGEVGVNQTKVKELVVYGNASQIIGTKENKVLLLSSQDIDQRVIEQETEENLTVSNINKKILKTNNYSNTELIVSIRTGLEKYAWVCGIFACLIIVGGIIIYFKRYNSQLK